MFVEFITILVTLTIGLIAYFKHKFKYWEKKGVPFREPSIPLGNAQIRLAQKRANHEVLQEHYEYFKSKGHKHGGYYVLTNPIYMAVDPDLIKRILTKDFAYFTDHGLYYDEKNDPLSAHLFSLEGERWKTMRTKVTPTFTSGKMKKMFHTLLDCGKQFEEYIRVLDSKKEPLDIKDILASFTTDVIGSCAFGIDTNSFKEPHSDFRENGRKLFNLTLSGKLRFACISLFPNLAKKIGFTIFHRSLTDFYFNVVKNMVKYREDNGVKRDDYLQILLDLKDIEGRLTMEEMGALAFGFILAGFETSSTALTFCLFEVAQNPDIQDKLRQEIFDMLENSEGKLSYESVMHLKYMGQVIEETLRMYPPLPTLMRKCVRDYKVPDTDIIIDKGRRVFISVSGLHFDPDYYSQPELFDPERFTEENKANRHPYTFLPFGEGPRMCIGLRFAMMQIRVGLVLLLRSYRLKLSPKTKVPLKMDVQSFLLAPQDTIWLETEKIV